MRLIQYVTLRPLSYAIRPLIKKFATMSKVIPPLENVTRLSDRVIRILGQNPGKFTLQGSNTFLVGTGPERILIDAGQGIPQWIDLVKETLEQEKAHISTVLITHWHPDHVGGIPDLLKLQPKPTIYKQQDVPMDHEAEPINDGQQFKVDGASLNAVHSPGHTHDHMSFVLEEEDALFTGDNVLGHGTAVFEDLPLYLNTLSKMSELVKGRAYPGHGETLPSAGARIREYLAHRAAREREVMTALVQQSGTEKNGVGSMQLVKLIYKDTPETLHLAASRGVIQVLDKLVSDGRAVFDDKEGVWTPTEKAVL
jgi:ribonuclease/clavin/mitogillin